MLTSALVSAQRAGQTLCSVSPTGCAGSSFTYAKCLPSSLLLARQEVTLPALWGLVACFAQVKEEPVSNARRKEALSIAGGGHGAKHVASPTQRKPAGLPLSPRMRRVVSLGQMLKIQPGVHLRGRNIGVAKQLLHRSQILAGLQNVAGKAVAQHVRMHRHR